MENENVNVWGVPFKIAIVAITVFFAATWIASSSELDKMADYIAGNPVIQENYSDDVVAKEEEERQPQTLIEATRTVYKLHDGSSPMCSAVAISKSQLVTAAHCVDSNRSYSIQVPRYNKNLEETSRTIHQTRRVRFMKANDTAFLELNDDSIQLTPANICNDEDYTIGDTLFAIGYPFADSLTLTEGMFTTRYKLNFGGLDDIFYQTTVPVEGGSSGGGLFRNDEEGACLTGITTAHRIGRGFFPSFFSTLDALKSVTRGLIR